MVGNAINHAHAIPEEGLTVNPTPTKIQKQTKGFNP